MPCLLQPIQRLLSSQFPDITALQTRSTHHAIAGSRHVFSALPPGRDKLAMLSEVRGQQRGRQRGGSGGVQQGRGAARGLLGRQQLNPEHSVHRLDSSLPVACHGSMAAAPLQLQGLTCMPAGLPLRALSTGVTP